MTFSVDSWPTADDVDKYAHDLKIDRDVVIRDIVRTITVAQLVHDETLGNDWVLAGGMAMRLRGSPRFTVTDADTSKREGWPDRESLSEALTIDADELTVAPADYLAWKSRNDILHAHPVNYEAFFAAVGAGSIVGEFKFTVSWRGLVEPAQKIPLRHPYKQLALPPTQVPVMDLTEQAAEKVVGWCANGLVKHYSDLAWIFWRLRNEVQDDKLARLVVSKLDAGRKRFPNEYATFPDLASVISPLLDPDDRVPPPLGDPEDDGRRYIRFVSTGVNTHLNQAQNKRIVRERVVPLLQAAA